MKTNLDFPDNVNLEFNKQGLKVSVSLNVPKELVHMFCKNNLRTGKHMTSYHLSYQMESKDITHENIHTCVRILTDRVMLKIREAKFKALENDINFLKKITNSKSYTQ